MIVVFNLVVIGIVGLIAYWWSNEGAFSGLLHLVCVVVAGALTLALWEPVLFDFMFVNGAWGGIMPGFVMLGLFVVILLPLRKAADMAAPDAALLPEGLDGIVGGVFGAMAGVITVGIVLVGVGFIHQPHELLGYSGWGRSPSGPDNQGLVDAPESGLWLPADRLTMDLYEHVSLTTLRPNNAQTANRTPQTLATSNPDLDRLASLVRDTVSDDKGRMAATVINPAMIKPSIGERVTDVLDLDRTAVDGEWLTVTVTVQKKGFDFKGQLLLSSSQVRVIGQLNGRTETYHPAAWTQPRSGKDEPIGQVFRTFNADDRYASSGSARKQVILRFVFAVADGFIPDYIQIRSTRLVIPGVREAASQDAMLASLGALKSDGNELLFGGDITSFVSSGAIAARFDRRIKPSTEKIQQLGGVWRTEDNRLVQINGDFKPNRPGETPRGKLLIKGYHVDKGAAIVRLACHPDTATDIFTAARKMRLPLKSEIQLLDVNNNDWRPVGFELVQMNRLIMMIRDDDLDTIADLPHRPRSGSDDRFYLIFEVPEGTQLSEIRLGEELLGTINGVQAERYIR